MVVGDPKIPPIEINILTQYFKKSMWKIHTEPKVKLSIKMRLVTVPRGTEAKEDSWMWQPTSLGSTGLGTLNLNSSAGL